MRIGCLQFSPQLGKVEDNITRANEILDTYPNLHLDVLLLPELAFTGYNFPSFRAIEPYLELLGAGPSYQWAKATAARLQCIVVVGYPQLASPQPPPTATATPDHHHHPICYNSTVTVSASGEILSNYNKTHLYYTDETWAQESPTGWHTTPLPLSPGGPGGGALNATFGICMDLNPYRFTAPWTRYEFALDALQSGTHLLLLSMAWMTRLPPPSSEHVSDPADPDAETLAYWCARLRPLVDQEDREVIVAIACRSGEEEGGDEVRYAGSSWIGRIGRGKIGVWGVLGRGEEGVLVADTEAELVGYIEQVSAWDVDE